MKALRKFIHYIRFNRVVSAIPTALLLVGLAYLLSLVMTAPFAFTASFLNTSAVTDFDFSDFYANVANQRPVSEVDQTVMVINLENSDRAEYAAILEALQSTSPAAIGIDVLFQEPHEPLTDEWLINSLRSLPNLVMTESLIKLPGVDSFKVSERSFFADTLGHGIKFAASNLPARITSGAIRTFRPMYPTADSTVQGLASALASIAKPHSINALTERIGEGKSNEIINYASRVIPVFTPGVIVDNPDTVNGKVLLVGSVSQTEDIHPTPVNHAMSGILIHAYAVSTILRNDYIDRVGTAGEWTIACILCFIITLGFCLIPVEYKGLTLRLTQMVMLLTVIYIGYYLFVEKNLIIDFSPSLLMITFGLFACDLRLGLVSIFKKSKSYLSKKSNKTLQPRQK